MPYCIQDKDGHCQDRHVSYFETGGPYDSEDDRSGGGDGGAAWGTVLVLVLLGLIVWGFASFTNWVESKQLKAEEVSFEGAPSSVFQGGGTSGSTDGLNEHYISQNEISRPQLEAGQIAGIRYGRPCSLMYMLPEGNSSGKWNLILPKAGYNYGPFIVSESVRFWCAFGDEQAGGRLEISSSKWRSDAPVVHRSYQCSYITEADTVEFYLRPLVDNVPFTLVLVR